MKKNSSKKLSLSQVQLAKILRYLAEIESSQSKILVVASQRDAYIREIDKEGKIDEFLKQIQHLKEMTNRSIAAHKKVMEEIETELGIKLDDYTVNDVTGELAKKE